jgi:hypothetical protein
MVTVAKIATGVIIGNIITFGIIIALSPYIKVERRVITKFF